MDQGIFVAPQNYQSAKTLIKQLGFSFANVQNNHEENISSLIQQNEHLAFKNQRFSNHVNILTKIIHILVLMVVPHILLAYAIVV